MSGHWINKQKEANMATAKDKMTAIVDELNEYFPERTALIEGAMTALLAGEHILMLGPPGTAKSLFARRVAEATAGGSFFELLLTKFTTVEEVYGPVSFSALKRDSYERILDGFAATKKVWFLDEIFKSSSAILNCQLTAMNERMFHNGGAPTPIPLEMVMAASNEYPQDESLKALFDRFTMKFWVDYISDRDRLEALLLAGGVPKMKNVLSEKDLSTLKKDVDKIKFGKSQTKILLDIKANIEQEGFIVSDRMWVKAVKMIKARAVMKGRTRVSQADFLILSDMMWKEHKDRDRLNTIIGKAADPYGARAIEIIDAVKTAMKQLPDMSILKSGQKTKVEFMKLVTEVSGQVASRRDALLDIDEECDVKNDSVEEAREVVDNAMKRVESTMQEVMFYRETKK